MSNNGDQRRKLEADVGARRVARVYAEALLTEAQNRNQAQEVLEELEAFHRDVLQADPQAEEFFTSAAVGRDRKAEALRMALASRASELLTNFLLVLNDHDHLDLIGAIALVYRDLLEERSGQMRVLVRSAVPLDPDHQERLRAELRRTFGREPLLEAEVDPELLGGLVVRVGDWLYDASVRTRLELIQNQLFERSSHEIQVGRDRFTDT